MYSNTFLLNDVIKYVYYKKMFFNNSIIQKELFMNHFLLDASNRLTLQ